MDAATTVDDGIKDGAPETHGAFGAGLVLAALGIVFGDIGTSPLYTLKTIMAFGGGVADKAAILGVFSLLVWTMVIVTGVKYVAFAMRVDNDGEGGILALMSLIGLRRGHRPAIVALGLFGAALIYGDGAITPAISVLSALEGLHLAVPSFDPYVLPAAVVILVALFAVQPRGTGEIGKVFGPVMATWFLAITAMGAYGVARHPGVLAGLSPHYAVVYLVHGGWGAFGVLGGVFLCVTGAEALYADMGHFGKGPIRLAWYAAVLPALVVSYAGQAGLVLAGGVPSGENPFFLLCPTALLVPLVLLSTAATVIASQAIITGAFSMTRQAIQLGWLPRMAVKQTSEEGYGQIYVGPVNWLLMVVTVALTLGFRKSDDLAAAYGIAVSLTMLLTSCLLYVAMREVWGWSKAAAGAVAAGFMVVDAAFVAANLAKVLEGGWVPLALAVAVFGTMRLWHQGTDAIRAAIGGPDREPVGSFLSNLEERGVTRPEGTAVFLTRARDGVPPLMAWHVKQNRSLYSDVVAMTVVTALVPRVEPAKRVEAVEEAPGFWRVLVRHGFVEKVDFGALVRNLKASGCRFRKDEVVYYVAHETIVPAERNARLLAPWKERVFAWMERNQAHLVDVLGLPSDRVVEIGRHVEL